LAVATIKRFIGHAESTAVPMDSDLRRWVRSEWVEYETWLYRHALFSQTNWMNYRQEACCWNKRPFISVLTPVYNTDPGHLFECILSVQSQAYPFWEMCLVDDGSDRLETKVLLRTMVRQDPRLKLFTLPGNQGICDATNQALSNARGEYVAFLDHDDRLAPDALFRVAEAIRKDQDTDMLYSDRDMLSPRGLRFMHVFKPGWSPETLLTWNYACHLTIYKRSLVLDIGGFRSDYEGHQDHDLILRAAETNPHVYHIPQILYSWRQHEESLSLKASAKEYVYESAIRALTDALQRRGLAGTVHEIPELWRGNFRVRLEPREPDGIFTISLEQGIEPKGFSEHMTHYMDTGHDKNIVIILGPGVRPADQESIEELASWFHIPEVGLVTGKVVDPEDHILHAGLVQRQNGVPLAIYQGFPESTPGYMAATATVRNVSAPHPACFAIRMSLLKDLSGLDRAYLGPHSVLDLALRCLEKGFRSVYTPFARFICPQGWWYAEQWPAEDADRFSRKWDTWLKKGDPYYNQWLTLEHPDMGLDLRPLG
jgi:glycosyltransferase involved in cell wall biosynthesis